MNKVRNNFPAAGILFICLLLIMSCNAQENPKYISSRYGVLDLEKITFSEQLDTLFSKAEKFYKIPKGKEQFNERLKRFVLQDTAYTLYRMSAKAIDKNTFKYRNVKIKPSEAVDFYMDRMGRFRKVEVSVSLNENQYKELLKNGKYFKEITPERVKKLNNDNYSILRKSGPGTLQTTLFILEDKETSNSNQRYFVRISRMNMKIADDRFYKELNDDVKFQKKL